MFWRVTGEIMLRRLVSGLAAVGLVVAFGLMGASPASASSVPSGQRMYGNTTFDAGAGHFVGGGGTIEPAYDDTPGTSVYLQTPNNTPVHLAHAIDPAVGLPRAVAPIYLPMYPVGSGIDPASLNCAHAPADNCRTTARSWQVSRAGNRAVRLHRPPNACQPRPGPRPLGRHCEDRRGLQRAGEPVLILFTSVDVSKTHITTLAQIKALEAASPPEVIEVPLPPATFHCSVVSVAAYNKATPAPTVVGP